MTPQVSRVLADYVAAVRLHYGSREGKPSACVERVQQ